MRGAAILSVLCGAAAVTVGYLAAGQLGFIAMVAVVVFCAVVGIAQWRAEPVATGRGRRAPARQRSTGPPDPLTGFVRLRTIESELAWAATDGRRYEPGVRRMFRYQYAAALSARNLDLDDVPAARALVGSDLWPYVCAEDSPDAARRAPGRALVLRLVDRLEQL